MNTLSVLCHDRPHYLRQTLSALARCDGIEDWRVVVIQDRPDPGTRHLVANVPARWETVELDLGNANDDPYARVSSATLMALSLGFATSDFVAHLEEDCVPAADALTWMAQMALWYRSDPSAFTVNAWSGPKVKGVSHALVPWFTPWLWGTWFDRYAELRTKWDMDHWDRGLNERIRGDRLGVFPPISKVRDIGEHGGVNPRSEWLQRQQVSA